LNGIAEQLNLEVPKESEQSEKKNGRVASQRKNAA
jgi:hypothetical protein